MDRQVLTQLGENSPLDEFRQERKIRHGPVIFRIVRIEIWFFKKGRDGSVLERGWKRASGEREIKNSCDGGKEMINKELQ